MCSSQDKERSRVTPSNFTDWEGVRMWPAILIRNDEIFLTLAGAGYFVSFYGTGGGWYDPRAVSPLIELVLWVKNERVAGRET